MRAARAMATVAMAAATLVPLTALAACDLGTSNSSAPPSQPAAGAPVDSAPATSAAPTAAPTSAAPTSAAPSSTATTPSHATRSTTPPVAQPPASTAVAPGKILDFGIDGKAVRLPVKASAVPGAPAGFLDGARTELTKHWATYDDDPGCEQVPVLWVNKISTAGFASVSYNDDPSQANGDHCQNVGGGVQEFWAVVNGTWKPVIVTQDVPTCAQFKTYGFPSAVVGTKCYDGNRLVAYKHA